VDVATGQRGAELCAINILAQAKTSLGGDLGRIRRVIKLNGFVASAPDFVEQHLVIDGGTCMFASFAKHDGNQVRSA
ncbi:RidA family protein, partial [Rhizobium leguminosarum]|uniref:RidA family protein n=1 Tax=Rhizobium leguminosarum TaxID=384 RepID=UPI003F9D2606